MSCCSCWPWCKTPPPPPVHQGSALQYTESKSVIRVVPPPAINSSEAKHGRVLSTMYIKDGKAIVTYRGISEEEADRKFGVVPAKTAQASTVRFNIHVEEPTHVSPAPHSSRLEYQPSMAVLEN